MSTKVFIANIPFTRTADQLEEFIRTAAKAKGIDLTVQECKVVKDQEGRSKGYGFVTFENEMSAKLVIGMNGVEFEGRGLIINEAKERPARPTGSRDPQSVHSFMGQNKGATLI